MEISQLRELQAHFETNRASTEKAKELYMESEKITKKFQEKFDREKLLSLTLEEYVVGHGSRDSLCYWLEHTTDPVEDYSLVGRDMPSMSTIAKRAALTLFNKGIKEKWFLKIRQTNN